MHSQHGAAFEFAIKSKLGNLLQADDLSNVGNFSIAWARQGHHQTASNSDYSGQIASRLGQGLMV